MMQHVRNDRIVLLRDGDPLNVRLETAHLGGLKGEEIKDQMGEIKDQTTKYIFCNIVGSEATHLGGLEMEIKKKG